MQIRIYRRQQVGGTSRVTRRSMPPRWKSKSIFGKGKPPDECPNVRFVPQVVRFSASARAGESAAIFRSASARGGLIKIV